MTTPITPMINTAMNAPAYTRSTREATEEAAGEKRIDLLTHQELLTELLANFDAFTDPRYGEDDVTKESLERTADGLPLFGKPPTSRQREIAQELLKRLEEFKKLDEMGGSAMFPRNLSFSYSDLVKRLAEMASND